MENKREQLAKALGVARYYFKSQDGEWFRGTEYAYHNRLEANEKWDIRPNFKEPYNFVQLLETKRKALNNIPNTMLCFLNLNQNVITATIDATIEELGSDFWIENGFVGKLLKEAQKTEWEY